MTGTNYNIQEVFLTKVRKLTIIFSLPLCRPALATLKLAAAVLAFLMTLMPVSNLL